ncbi:MAG: dihydrolipoyllysine-residue acetyltransferase [Bdellovibrionota bacterium]
MALTEVKLPELGEGVTEGELIKYLVKPGDQVKADQSIAELMTDKATVEVPSPQAGTVKELKFKVGDIIKVEAVLLTLDGVGSATATATATATNSGTGTASQSAKTATPAATAPTAAAPQASSNGKSNGPAPAATGGGQTINVKLPELGEGVAEGELVKWLVKPGDQVKADQSVAELMTDKATVEIPSPQAGTVKELKFKVGDTLKVESVILTLTGAGGSATATATATATNSVPAQKTSAPAQTSAPAPVSSASVATPAGASAGQAMAMRSNNGGTLPAADLKVLATPSTRRLAREMGVDINQLGGTGLAGRVTRDDVMKTGGQNFVGASSGMQTPGFNRPSYNAPPMVPGAGEERVPLRGIRKKIAQNLQMAKAIIPHFTLMDECDVTELVALREMLKEAGEKQGAKITYLPFVIKALIATIREFPQFNASIDDQAEEIVYKKYFNIGFAADTPNGLLVPVIKNADVKNIIQLSKEIVDLSVRAREGKLKMEEMKGATITITNIGSVGGTYATPIINHPEVAIIGMYKISDRPVIKNGLLSSVKVMNYTVTADHRLIDGAVAANFLKAFLGRLSKPGSMMLEMM